MFLPYEQMKSGELIRARDVPPFATAEEVMAYITNPKNKTQGRILEWIEASTPLTGENDD